MAERKVEVKVFRVDYICDECGKGHMLPTGEVLTSYPAKYPHVCDACGAKRIFVDKTYPMDKTEPIECSCDNCSGECKKEE